MLLHVLKAVSGDESIINMNPLADSACGLNDLEEETEIRDATAKSILQKVRGIGVVVSAASIR